MFIYMHIYIYLYAHIYILYICTYIYIWLYICCCVQLFVTQWTAARQPPLSSTISWSLFRFMSIESVVLSNHLVLCCPLSFCLQPFPASVISNESFVSAGQSIGASASVLPMNIENWFALGLTGLMSLQSRGLSWVFSSTTIWKHWFLILQCSTFFMVQLSCLYMTAGKTIALTIRTFVSKVMPLLFNMLPRFVIAFLQRSKYLLQSPFTLVILEPKKIKSVTVSIVSPSICHEVMGPDAMILVFWMLSFKPDFS